MSRWKAEYFDGGRTPGGPAADLGTTCHLALETWVQQTIVLKRKEPTLKYLLDCYTTAYLTIMKSFDFESLIFKDGERMMRVWFDRNDFEGINVLSTESKESFQLPYIAPDGTKQFITFNFICDRVDEVNGDIKVIDYKSWRGLIGPEDLKSDIQARSYALAMQIKHPEARGIWVVMDQLRGEEVGYFFTRDDNKVTFRALKVVLQRIVNTEPRDVRETLNDECRWCVRRAVCRSLTKHTAVGGQLDTNLDDLIKLRFDLQAKVGALKGALEEVDERIKKDFDELDLRTLDTLDSEYRATTTAGKSRYEIDGSRLPKIVGPEIALEVAEFKKTRLEELRGDPRISADLWKQIETVIVKFPGRRGLRVTKVKKEGDQWSL